MGACSVAVRLAQCHTNAACQRWEIQFSQAAFVCFNFKIILPLLKLLEVQCLITSE